MPPKQWDDEDSDSSSGDDVPKVQVAGRRRFDDEEEEEDLLDSWDAAEDSEVEREKEKKAAEAKAKAAAAALAAKKPKSQRIAEHQEVRSRKKAEDSDTDEEETEAERRERLRQAEQDADLKHAADMFGDIGISAGRSRAKPTTVAIDSKDPNNTVDIGKLPVFNPTTKSQFETLRTTIAPLIAAHAKKPHYGLFLQDFAKDVAREMSSEQIKKLASALTALGNEKQREEKNADKGNKKTKAAKTKTSLAVGRSAVKEEIGGYEQEDFGDDDFM